MTASSVQKRLALLVDGENVPSDVMGKVLPIVARIGVPAFQRVYGNFANGAHKAWIAYVRNHQIEARQVTPAKSGKNATDIALVIDAMDIALRDRFDAICIVSSDRDFQPLVDFMRREGVEVYGFGKSDADKKFKDSCTAFHAVLTVAKTKKTQATKVAAALPKAKAAKTTLVKGEPKVASAAQATGDWDKIRSAMDALAARRQWIPLPQLATALNQEKLRPTEFGSRCWLQVFKKDSRFQVEKELASTQSRVRLVA